MALLRHVPVSCGNAECYVVIGVTFIVPLTCSNVVELRGFEPRTEPAEIASDLR